MRTVGMRTSGDGSSGRFHPPPALVGRARASGSDGRPEDDVDLRRVAEVDGSGGTRRWRRDDDNRGTSRRDDSPDAGRSDAGPLVALVGPVGRGRPGGRDVPPGHPEVGRFSLFDVGLSPEDGSVSFDRLGSLGGICVVVVGVALGRRWPVLGDVADAAPVRHDAVRRRDRLGMVAGHRWPWPRSRRSTGSGGRSSRPPPRSLVAAWYCRTALPAVPARSERSRRRARGAARGILTLHVVIVLTVVTFGCAVGIAAPVVGPSGRCARRRAARLEVESLAGERARLARDLHDVVAHHVSLVAVRAESAPYLHPGLNDDARERAGGDRDGRPRGPDGAAAGARRPAAHVDESERAPQPTACDVDDLVAAAIAAGQPIDADRARGTTSARRPGTSCTGPSRKG